MENFRIKTHQGDNTYQKPHFFILNKGLNSGKPLLEACPNCYVCMLENESEKDFLFWLCYSLWRSGTFHYYLKGSVIPFITIGDLKKYLQSNILIANNKLTEFEKTVQTLKLLDENEKKLKATLRMMDTARKAIFYDFIKKCSIV